MRSTGMSDGSPASQGSFPGPGVVVSGVLHAGAILGALYGGFVWGARAPEHAITLSDVTVITEAEYFGAVAAAPEFAEEPVDGLDAPETTAAPEVRPDAADPGIDRPVESVLAATGPAALDAAERPAAVALPPARPAQEAPPQSLAETRVDDAPPPSAPAAPQNRPPSDAVQPLASRAVDAPGPRPEAPQRPDVETAAETEVATEDNADAEAETATETEVAEAATDAGAAPSVAAIPRSRPANVPPAREPATEPSGIEQLIAEAEAAERAETAERQAQGQSGSGGVTANQRTARAPNFSQQVSRGERDALSIGIREYFTYNGRPAPGASVTVAIALDRGGRITNGPRRISAQGADGPVLDLIYRQARIALLRAASAGVFARLPAAKYAAWAEIHVTFTPDKGGVSFSS